jgi:predicted thioredoxin/glutaredoxin
LDFDLIVAENCCACGRAEKELKRYSENVNFINMKISFHNLSPYKTTIVPSLFINGKLFSYGDIDFKLLEEKMKKLKT